MLCRFLLIGVTSSDDSVRQKAMRFDSLFSVDALHLSYESLSSAMTSNDSKHTITAVTTSQKDAENFKNILKNAYTTNPTGQHIKTTNMQQK